MFWGLIMEPNKWYSEVVEESCHISQAALDIYTGDNDPCQVMVVVGGIKFLVCTLQKDKCIQVPLDLFLKTGESVSFLTIGNGIVHLTGYLVPYLEEEPSDEEEEEEEDEEEEVPALVPAKIKRKLYAKAKYEMNKPAAATEESSDESDDKYQLRRLVHGDDLDTHDTDDSFNRNTFKLDNDENESEEEKDVSKDEAETTLYTIEESQELASPETLPNMRVQLPKTSMEWN